MVSKGIQSTWRPSATWLHWDANKTKASETITGEMSGKYKRIDEIAAANNVDCIHVSRILQLTSLSPTIVEQILEGKEPEGMSLRQL